MHEERDHAAKRLSSASDKHEELSEKIEFAVTEGRDDLAEAAIARQLDLEAQLPVLESALKDFSDQEAELEGYIAALNARRREMEDDLQSFLRSREEQASANQGTGNTSPQNQTADAKTE